MAAASNELLLLDRVFLRLVSAETDEQFEAAICKFLPAVLLKLSSSQNGVRERVMELLNHVNRRLKSRPQVQLPVEGLLLQYQDPSATAFVINFTIIYIKLGYPRLEVNKQAELIPSVLKAIQGKPLLHQDSLMLMVMPAVGHIVIPIDSQKRASLLGFQDEPQVAKQFLHFMLDMLLLPYGAVTQNENPLPGQPINWSKFPVPPGLSEYAFKRVVGESIPSSEQLEQTKLGIVKFIAGGFFSDSEILIHLIVAASDTRFSVANVADSELKKIVNTLDWSSMQLAAPLYSLFLGSDATKKEVPQELKRVPANIRIRLKLMQYLCRVTKAGFIIPPCIQVIFESLYRADNTNSKLKTLALQFTSNFVQQCSLTPIIRVAQVILNGMLKLIGEDTEPTHKLMAYTIIGHLGQRIPSLVNKDLSLLQNFFDMLSTTDADLRRTIRDSLISMTPAFVLSKENENGISLMIGLLSSLIESPEAHVRFVAVHYSATVFPADHAPSRYLLLLASGDSKSEVQAEALKSLYGTSYKNERYKNILKEVSQPDFPELLSYIHSKIQARMNSNSKVTMGSKTLPYDLATYGEIITYLRICLLKSANVTVKDDLLTHPCESTPLIGRYLEELFKKNSEVLTNYINMIVQFGQVSGDEIALSALLEIIGTVPDLTVNLYVKERPWIQSLLSSTKEYVRDLAAKIDAIFTAYTPTNDFENQISKLLKTVKDKTIEIQHGALLVLSYSMERKLVLLRDAGENILANWNTYVDVVKAVCGFLDINNSMIAMAAVDGIGGIGKSYALPLTSEGEENSKLSLTEKLFSIFMNAKSSDKMKEKAALSLGYICVGEEFPHTKMIAQKFLDTATETKDINIHLSVGEALVYCVQGSASFVRRDAWRVLPTEHSGVFTKDSDELLISVIDKLIAAADKPHPNSRQAVCTWLLTILKYNCQRPCILVKLPAVQSVFLDFLCGSSDIIEDIACKGLFLIYTNCSEKDKPALVSSLIKEFLHARMKAAKAPETTEKAKAESSAEKETKIRTGGNMPVYKEICSLAVDLNKPELTYPFLSLANHNPVWSSKKGVLLGFSQQSKLIDGDFTATMPKIIPKLYRYQFDPLAKAQQSFTSIWRAIVPSTSKALEQHHEEIINDITTNLTSGNFRVRISCCLALADLLKSPVPINYAERAAELWKQLFRVMDDIQEGARIEATNTAKILSRVCIRECDVSSGKSGEKVLQAILPVLLDNGISSSVQNVRFISLQTVSQLVTIAGNLLKPSLPVLIPALLVSVGEMENNTVMELRSRHANSSEVQERIDDATIQATKTSFIAETMKKCLLYIDAPILKDLMPKVIELLKSSLKLSTKVACSNLLVNLSIHMKQELQPYSGKVLQVLMNGLTDRNTGVRSNSAQTIGNIVGCAKESSLEKMFNTLNTWYTEREDNSTRLAIGQALQSISHHNQDILKKHSRIVMPLTFFAMHAEAIPNETDKTVELWTELWSEITPGTEAGIRQNLGPITTFLNTALESASWTTKAQAANAVSTVATKLGATIDEEARNSLLNILVNGLQGRTWNGKYRLLEALATLASNSKEAVKSNAKLKETIIETLYRESKKEGIEYRRHALKAFTEVLHELDEDKFTQVYDIAQEVLPKLNKKSEDDEDDSAEENKKKREEKSKLQETIYESLGKAWPSCKESQDQYGVKFLMHCFETLPTSTRPVQVTILTALNHFVDKLVLLKVNANETSEKDKEMLDSICGILLKILRYAIGIAKYTRIRKEALNIVLSLSRKLNDTQNDKHLDYVTALMNDMVADLTKDNQPEIRSRVVDIKTMLKL